MATMQKTRVDLVSGMTCLPPITKLALLPRTCIRRRLVAQERCGASKRLAVTNLLEQAEYDGGVVAAEAETVAHGVLKTQFASGVRRVIEIAIGIGIGEIDRGGNGGVRKGFD